MTTDMLISQNLMGSVVARPRNGKQTHQFRGLCVPGTAGYDGALTHEHPDPSELT